MDAVLEATGGQGPDNVAAWCRVNGIEVRTFFRHRARYRLEGSWAPRSRRPRCSPGATPQPVCDAVLELREVLAPDNGADPIRAALGARAEQQGWAARGWVVPSRATINRVLDRAGMLVKDPTKRPRASYRRFSFARPRDCFQIDATVHDLAGGAHAVAFDVIDDASRVWVACHVRDAETIAGAVAALSAAVEQWGAPALVLADNGTAFAHPRRDRDKARTSTFGRVLSERWGTRLIHSSPYHPQTLGKNERLHQTAKKLLAHHWPDPPADTTELDRRLQLIRQHYNQHRRHSAIATSHAVQTPAQAWNAALTLGGPEDLPHQHDATITRRRVAANGAVTLGGSPGGTPPASFSVGRGHAGTVVTVLRDGHHVTVYSPDGTPLGHRHLDPTKRYQGQLTQAPA